MLKRFEVENFKGFKDRIVFDLTAREYSFNPLLVDRGIVNKAIIYGKNGIGKSSLGIALFDIVSHLTDKEKMPSMYLSNYINLESNTKQILSRGDDCSIALLTPKLTSLPNKRLNYADFDCLLAQQKIQHSKQSRCIKRAVV